MSRLASALFVLAMDHGPPLQVAVRARGDAPEQTREDARRQAGDLRRAPPSRGSGLEVGRAGVLVDEHLGSEVARRAKLMHRARDAHREERTNLFELEYARTTRALGCFDPDFFKVLVRYNPADKAADRTAQIERLAEVSRGGQAGWPWLFELLVPPTREQLAQNEDQFNFDRHARPN